MGMKYLIGKSIIAKTYCGEGRTRNCESNIAIKRDQSYSYRCVICDKEWGFLLNTDKIDYHVIIIFSGTESNQ